MKDNSIWNMFCETGEPVCYLIYRRTVKEKETRFNFPPQDTVALCGSGEEPEARF